MSYDIKIINGDFSLKNGDLDIVEGQDKLIQDILKICLTEVGANIYNPWYGSYIHRSLIGSNLDTNITADVAKSQLQNSLETLQKLQQLQTSDTMQKVSPSEHIAAISNISVDRSASDPRFIEVIINVLSRAFSRTTVKFDV